MVLPKPTTSQLMTILPSWSIAAGAYQREDRSDWRAVNVAWTWTPEEFMEQTRMLAMNDCKPRDMVAWLVHGVRWEDTREIKYLTFDSQVLFWRDKSVYIRAWVEGSNASVPEETLDNLCTRIDWHPVWRNLNLSTILGDFYWSRDVGEQPRRMETSRRSRSFMGSVELAQSAKDYPFLYSCAEYPIRNMRWRDVHGVPYSGTRELLESQELEKLSPTFQRCLLIASLVHDDPGSLTTDCCKKAHVLWSNNLSLDEQQWWEKKARSMYFTNHVNRDLLDNGIHPLLMVYRDKGQDLALLQDLSPDYFCTGSMLVNLLSQHGTYVLPLPDLDGINP